MTTTSSGTGTSGGSTAGSNYNFNYPTPQEMSNTIYSQPFMQQQYGLLNQMGDMGAFKSAIQPEIESMMKALGRTGLVSGSYADKTMTETMGSLYNKWLWNVLQGYQGIGQQMPGLMQQWYSPYNTMLSYVGS
jgi:hypothetical protein